MWDTVQCTYYPNLVFLIFNYIFGLAIPTCGVNPRHNFQKLLVMLKITSFLNFFPWMLHWKNFSKTLAFPPEGCVLSCVKIKVDTSRMSGAPTFVSIKSSLKSVIITNIFLHMYILCMLLQIKMPVICPKVCTRVSLLGHWGTWPPLGFGSLTWNVEKISWNLWFCTDFTNFQQTVGNNLAKSKTSLVVFTKNFKNRAKFFTSKILSKANY